VFTNGLIDSDHLQPGSKVFRLMVNEPIFAT
jgi:hypothetical protein